MGLLQPDARYHRRTDECEVAAKGCYMSSPGLISIDDVELRGKPVLVRVDFNVPLKDGHVEDDTRIRATMPTIRKLLEDQATVILMSHLGRPREGEFDAKYSMVPVAARLSELLGLSVPVVTDWNNGIDFNASNIVMLENVRFLKGEKSNDDELAQQLATLCDIYVNDAFATAHRAQASTHGIAKFVPLACAGPLLLAEINALSKALEQPARPMIAIVGGSKVSTKLTVLENLLDKVDQLIVGGGIANTFLRAAGFNIGTSLHEPDLVDVAGTLMDRARKTGKEIPLPTDVVCGLEFSEDTPATTKFIAEVDDNDMILDVGPETTAHYAGLLDQAKTIVWNGPLGVFEFNQFSNGTRVLAKAIAQSKAFSIAGGGDTLAAISKFNISDDISYISTGGGAFLELLEGKELPAITILKESAKNWTLKQTD